MKKIKPFLIFATIIPFFNSCQKDPVSKPVKFTETTYTTVSSYDNKGVPNGLLHDNISSELWSFINGMLPDNINLSVTHPELFSATATGDIPITQPCDVYVTFVQSKSAYSNSLAFYTYPSSTPPASAKDIKNIIYFFPNVGRLTGLNAGDKIKIGKFDPGTSIGFVLMQNAWDTVYASLNNDAVHFCSNDVLNPEVDPKLKRHAVLINYEPENKVLVGFEDTNRTNGACDHDFNDVVIYCTVAP